MDTTLKLKSDLRIIEPVTDFSYKFGLNAGLTKEEATKLALAIDELVTDIVLFAYKNEKGEFEISFNLTDDSIEIIVHELGEPFDPNKHKYDVKKVIEKNDFEGAGLRLIENLVDNFLFINKGAGGKEFRIVKNIKFPHITELFTHEEMQVEPAKAVSYTLSRVTPKDAEDISKLIYRVYGYTYPKEEMYYPEKIRRILEKGEKYAVIVRTDKGEAVGYFAIIRSTDSKIGEVGEAVVSREHRGKGIMTMMMKALIDIAKEKGLLGLFGEAVTVHTVSQRVNAKYGFKTTALLVGFFPHVEYKGFETGQQRISVVIDFLPLTERNDLEIYIPKRYKKIIKEIYKNMGINIKDKRVTDFTVKEKTIIQMNISFKYGQAVLVVKSFGNDFIHRVQEKVKTLKKKGIKAVYIDLPVENAGTKIFTDQLFDLGFVFAGIMPLFHHQKDYLRMQMVFEDINFKYINVYSDMAHKIKNKVSREFKWNTQKMKSI